MEKKRRSSQHFPSAKGYTLLEVTAVVAVLMGLMVVLFLGAKEYKKGSDRAACIQNIATMQRIVRSFGNINGKFPGESVADLELKLIGPGKFIEFEPTCPADGVYTYFQNTLPLPGTLFLDCSIDGHEPDDYASW